MRDYDKPIRSSACGRASVALVEKAGLVQALLVITLLCQKACWQSFYKFIHGAKARDVRSSDTDCRRLRKRKRKPRKRKKRKRKHQRWSRSLRRSSLAEGDGMTRGGELGRVAFVGNVSQL